MRGGKAGESVCVLYDRGCVGEVQKMFEERDVNFPSLPPLPLDTPSVHYTPHYIIMRHDHVTIM